MKKLMPLAASIVLILVASVFASAGTLAIFTDTEEVGPHVLTAGTLDLEVGSSAPVTFTVSDMKPGDDTGYYKWELKNVGSIPGQPYVEFSAITNKENGRNEPEKDAGDTGAPGELGQYLKYTIGVGPFSWSVPSLLISEWQTGPVHPWGTPGLDGLAGNTYFKGPTGYMFPVLNSGETYGFFMKLSLDDDLQIWDGTKWIEVDDNIIQSDGVQFDIIFHLDQAP